MTIHRTTSNDDLVLYQLANDSEMAEPAILLKDFSDCIELVQDEGSIIVGKSKANINELIKALKLIAKNIED